MNSKIFYKFMSNFYDLLDVVYFRKFASSPRKVVIESIDEKDAVLDLCTGTATNAINIAKEKRKVKIVGVDLSEDMLTIAKMKRKKEKVHNIKFYCMDATQMTFKAACFDKVLLSLVLHETEEALANKIVEEAVRVMKDDGELILTEWERSDKWYQKIIYLPIELLEPKPYKTFIVKDLKAYFAQFGLEIVSESHCDYSKVLRLKKCKLKAAS